MADSDKRQGGRAFLVWYDPDGAFGRKYPTPPWPTPEAMCWPAWSAGPATAFYAGNAGDLRRLKAIADEAYPDAAACVSVRTAADLGPARSLLAEESADESEQYVKRVGDWPFDDPLFVPPGPPVAGLGGLVVALGRWAVRLRHDSRTATDALDAVHAALTPYLERKDYEDLPGQSRLHLAMQKAMAVAEPYVSLAESAGIDTTSLRDVQETVSPDHYFETVLKAMADLARVRRHVATHGLPGAVSDDNRVDNHPESSRDLPEDLPAPAPAGPWFPADHYKSVYAIEPDRLRKAKDRGTIDGRLVAGRWQYRDAAVRAAWPQDFICDETEPAGQTRTKADNPTDKAGQTRKTA